MTKLWIILIYLGILVLIVGICGYSTTFKKKKFIKTLYWIEQSSIIVDEKGMHSAKMLSEEPDGEYEFTGIGIATFKTGKRIDIAFYKKVVNVNRIRFLFSSGDLL